MLVERVEAEDILNGLSYFAHSLTGEVGDERAEFVLGDSVD